MVAGPGVAHLDLVAAFVGGAFVRRYAAQYCAVVGHGLGIQHLGRLDGGFGVLGPEGHLDILAAVCLGIRNLHRQLLSFHRHCSNILAQCIAGLRHGSVHLVIVLRLGSYQDLLAFHKADGIH